MSPLVNDSPTASSAPESAQEKPGFRTKTIATRITPEELREVEAAAEKSGKTLAVWLRELALNAARERPADPTELMLAELSALRYMLLNLFHASASAQTEGKYLLPESVVKIRDKAEARKLTDARKLLTDFLAGSDGTGGRNERWANAFSQPWAVASVADFALPVGAVSGSSSGLAVARLDDESRPDFLPRNLCGLLCFE